MTQPRRVVALTDPSRADQVFPTLTPEQIKRVAARGRVRAVRSGEVLQSTGQQAESFFLVTKGSVEIVRRTAKAEEIVAVQKPGQFTGETNMLSGRQALMNLVVAEPGEVIEVKRADLVDLLQTDSELSDILMRAFLLRRVELIAKGLGDVVVVGSNFCQATQRVKEFLTRNGHPYTFLDLDGDPGVAGPARQAPHRREGGAGPHLPGDRRAPESEQPRDRRLSGLQRGDRPGARPRHPRHRGRAVRSRRRGVRGLRGARRAGRRIGGAGRTGRLELEDRELPRLPDRHLGTGARVAGAVAGGEVRGGDAGREGCAAAFLRAKAVRDRDRRRPARPGRAR